MAKVIHPRSLCPTLEKSNSMELPLPICQGDSTVSARMGVLIRNQILLGRGVSGTATPCLRRNARISLSLCCAAASSSRCCIRCLRWTSSACLRPSAMASCRAASSRSLNRRQRALFSLDLRRRSSLLRASSCSRRRRAFSLLRRLIALMLNKDRKERAILVSNVLF